MSDAATKSMIEQSFSEGLFNKTTLAVSDPVLKRILMKAKGFYDTGNYARARDLYAIAVLLDDKVLAGLYGLASALFMLEEIEPAFKIFLNYTTYAPEDPLGFHFIALCLEKKQNYAGALQALDVVAACPATTAPQVEIKHRAILSRRRIQEKLVQ